MIKESRPYESDQVCYPDWLILKNNGQEIANARQKRGLNRDELAERAGVHVNTIGIIERGQRDTNGLTQTRIFAALGCVGIQVLPEKDIIMLGEHQDTHFRKDILIVPDSRKISLMGEAVRQRRTALDMSLEELGERTGLHKNTIWNYERGLVSPSGLTIHRIYRALNVSLVMASPSSMCLS